MAIDEGESIRIADRHLQPNLACSRRRRRRARAAADAQPLDGRTNPRASDLSDEEQIASGSCAYRGHLPHIGIRFARMGSLGRRRAVGCPSSRRRQLAARAVGGATFSLSALGVIRSRRCLWRTSGLSRTAARPRRKVATVGHGRHDRVVQAPAPSFVRACR